MTNYKICSQCSLPSASRDFQNNVEQKFSFHTDYILTTDGAIPYSYNTHHQSHKSGSGILVWSTNQNFPKSGLAPSVDKSMYINSCVLPVHALKDNNIFGFFFFFFFKVITGDSFQMTEENIKLSGLGIGTLDCVDVDVVHINQSCVSTLSSTPVDYRLKPF